MKLSLVMRIIAALMVLVVTLEYFLLGELLVPPLVIVAILLVLSVIAGKFPKTVAVICLPLCFLVPAGAVMGYLAGQLVVLIPIFDVLVFAWLLWAAIRTLWLGRPSPVA